MSLPRPPIDSGFIHNCTLFDFTSQIQVHCTTRFHPDCGRYCIFLLILKLICVSAGLSRIAGGLLRGRNEVGPQLVTVRQQSWGEVMFSAMSVCNSFCPRGPNVTTAKLFELVYLGLIPRSWLPSYHTWTPSPRTCWKLGIKLAFDWKVFLSDII